MANDLTETTVLRLADVFVNRIKQQHVCVHEADLAVLSEARKRLDQFHDTYVERHQALLDVVDELGKSQVKTDEIMRQLGSGQIELQKTAKQHDIDLAKSSGGKRAALIIASLVSAFIGSLGGIVAVLSLMRTVIPR